jgi:hypothetical protein
MLGTKCHIKMIQDTLGTQGKIKNVQDTLGREGHVKIVQDTIETKTVQKWYIIRSVQNAI